MTARFAGSRTLDERRRRRLASNESERSPGSASGKSSPSEPDEPAEAEVKITHFPLRKVISPKGWKISLVGALVFLAGAGILAASLSTADSRTLGPGWTRLVHPHGGALARMFHAAVLLFSGQTALLIWWARSQSLRDFGGRYHLWLWSAVGSMLAAGSLAGDWHWAWSDTICWLWSARFPQRDVLCWMVPGLILAGILWRKLRADMRDSTASSLLLWLSAAACLGACLFRLGIDRTGWDDPARQFSGACLQMLTCTALFVSFLVHARFVIHISAEPPIYRPSLWARCFQGIKTLIGRLPRPKLKTPVLWKRKTDPTSNAASGQAKQNGGNQPAKKRSEKSPANPKAKPAAAPATNEAKVQTPKTAAEPQEPAKESETAKQPAKPQASKSAPPPAETKPASRPEPTSAQPTTAEENPATAPGGKTPELRVDQPLDPDVLKGLSKKERRRLRKQHRDAQRSV